MTDEIPKPSKPRRFDPDKRWVVALAAAGLVWTVLFLGLALFTSLTAAQAAGLSALMAFLVFLAGAGFQVTAAFYAMVLEAVFSALGVIAGILAAIFGAFS